MPKAIEADWKLIELLYTQGIRLARIQERTGVSSKVISTRASRYGWGKRMQAAIEVMKSEPDLSDLVAESSRKARNKLSKHLVSCVETIEEPTTMEEALEQQAKLEPLVRNAEKLFRWSEGASQTLINIKSLSAEQAIDDMPDIQPMPDIPTTTS